jgi:hypothetical protein
MGAVVTAVVTWDFTSPTLVDSTSGVELSCTRTSEKIIPDSTGRLRRVLNNTPSFQGADWTINRVENIDNWPSPSGLTPVQNTGVTLPAGVASAWDLEDDSASLYDNLRTDVDAGIYERWEGERIMLSIFILKTVGSSVRPAISIGDVSNSTYEQNAVDTNDGTLISRTGYADGGSGIIDFDANWWRYYAYIDVLPGNSDTRLVIYPATDEDENGVWSAVDTGIVTVAGPMFEVVAATTTTPSDYVATDDIPVQSYSGTAEGLLTEQSATNICLYSEDFSQSNWIHADVDITANATTAPDGGTGATLFEANKATDTFAPMSQTMNVGTGGKSIISAYLKAGTTDWVFMDMGLLGTKVTNAYFDLTNGVVGATGADVIEAGMIPAAFGFYRCWVRFNEDATDATGSLRIVLASGDGNTNVVLGDSIYCWGVMCEDGATIESPSSYIPTFNTSVTRAMDAVAAESANTWYPNGQDHSWYYKGEFQDKISNVEQWCISTRNTAQNDIHRIRKSTGAGALAYIGTNVDGGGTAVVSMSGSISADTTFEVAVRIAADDTQAYRDGFSSAADTDCGVPSEINTFQISRGTTATDTANNLLHKHVIVYNVALTDQQLEDASSGTLPTFGMEVGDEDWTRRRKLLEWARSGIRPFGGHKWK